MQCYYCILMTRRKQMPKCSCNRSKTNPTYNIHGGFTFPMDENKQYGGYAKIDLEFNELDPSIPIEDQLNDDTKNHVVKAQRYLMEELDRQIIEIKGLEENDK